MKLQTTVIEELKAKFRGEVLTPNGNGYQTARAIWNGMFDRNPAVIARAVGTSDVVNAVKFARDNELLVSIKGGGHNSAGTGVCADGFVSGHVFSRGGGRGDVSAGRIAGGAGGGRAGVGEVGGGAEWDSEGEGLSLFHRE